MNPSNPAKFGVAFAAGLVVALAGVVTYVKTTGLQVQEAPAVAPVVQRIKQPESLSTAKPVNPPTVDVTPPDPVPVLAAATPAPAAPTVQKREKVQPPVRHAPLTQVARVHYPAQSSWESPSSIRVEVSQMKPATAPIAEQSAPAVQTPAIEPVPTVSENQQVAAPSYNGPAPPQPHTVTLQTGTNLLVRLGETLSTDHNYSGDTFRASLDRPIILDGFVIAEKGSKVLGKIVGLDKAGKFEGTSNLQLALVEINTTDGQRVRIQTGFFNKKGPSNNGAEAAKIGGGAVLGAVIGAIAGGGKGAAIGAGAGGAVGAGAVMMGKGKPAVLPTETQLSFQLSSPTTITEHLN